MLVCIRYSYHTSFFIFIFLLRGARRTFKFCAIVFEKSGPNVPCILTGKPNLPNMNTGQRNSWARATSSFSTRILCVSEIRANPAAHGRGGGVHSFVGPASQVKELGKKTQTLIQVPLTDSNAGQRKKKKDRLRLRETG